MAEPIKNDVVNDVKKFFEAPDGSVKKFGGRVIDKIDDGIERFKELITFQDGKIILYTKKIEELKDTLQTGRESDPETIDFVCEAFETEIRDGNEEALKMLNVLIKIKQEHPEFVIRADADEFGGGAYFVNGDSKELGLTGVHFDKDTLDGKHYGTVFHEFAHLLHYYITDYSIADIDTDKIWGAYQNLKQDENWAKFIGIKGETDNIFTNAEEDYFKEKGIDKETYKDKVIIKMGAAMFASKLTLLNKFLNMDFRDGNKNTDDIPQYLLDKMGIDHNTYQEMMSGNISVEELVDKYIEDEINLYADSKVRDKRLNAVHDIFDAISGGTLWRDYGIYGHGESYYRYYCEDENGEQQWGYQMDNVVAEIVANYTDLKTSGNEEAIAELRIMLGDEIINEIDIIYQEIMSY